MDVGVAILATLPDVSEHRLCVALDARNRRMHSPQWILCRVVIEFRDGANWLPCAGGVAILAGDIQVPMWAVRPTGNLSVRASQCAEKRNNDYCEQFEYALELEHDVPRLHNVDINRNKLRRDDLDVLQFSIQAR